MSFTARVTWLFNSIGYNNKLLYMEPILKAFVSQFPMTTVLTCETEAKIGETNHEVKKAIPRFILKFAQRTLTVPSPSAILKLAQTKPEVIIIKEFGLLSLYAILYRTLKKKTRVLLLVENDPLYLKYYGVSRNSSVYDFVRRFIGRIADKVLCNNDKTARYLINHLGISAEKVTSACYLTSAIDMQGSTRSYHHDKLVLLFVGQLIPRKGLKHLLNAINLLPYEQRARLKLEVLGEGPERGFLEKLIQEKGLQNAVTFHGQQSYEKMCDFYTQADIFVLPTLGDYRALVGFEALSAGLPIIGSVFDGASSEIIEEGVNGFVVDPRDEEILSKKIQIFFEKPALIEKFGKESKRIAEKYSVRVAAANLITACKDCIGDLKHEV